MLRVSDAGPHASARHAYLGSAFESLQGRNPREAEHPVVARTLWGFGRDAGRRGWAEKPLRAQDWLGERPTALSPMLAGGLGLACWKAQQPFRALIGTCATDAGHEPAPTMNCSAVVVCRAASHDVSILITADTGDGR